MADNELTMESIGKVELSLKSIEVNLKTFFKMLSEDENNIPLRQYYFDFFYKKIIAMQGLIVDRDSKFILERINDIIRIFNELEKNITQLTKGLGELDRKYLDEFNNLFRNDLNIVYEEFKENIIPNN